MFFFLVVCVVPCVLVTGCETPNPPQLLSVICNACDVKQAPSRACTNPTCLVPFSTNHCEICMIWTQSDIFHCHGCGLCRVGKSDTLFHCETCEACFHISTRDTHYCTKISMKHQRCPLCLEDTHFSQKRCVVMRCGHVGHFDCLQEAWTHEAGDPSRHSHHIYTPPFHISVDHLAYTLNSEFFTSFCDYFHRQHSTMSYLPQIITISTIHASILGYHTFIHRNATIGRRRNQRCCH